MSVHDVRFTLNGVERTVRVPAERLLVDMLRYDCGLTGTKEGCGIGVCGACSVIVDGTLQSACLLPAVLVDGSAVRTVEGLAENGELTPLQDAFIRKGGFQCGICTPGQLVSATALLEEKPQASAEEIREWMTGNLCRCTGYYQIVEAILEAEAERAR
jgi:carbon-monoxide dehydrogenase small subunit